MEKREKLFLFFHFSFTGGCSNPDSYYINIRTGIHYFPRGFNSNDSISNSSRFKTDLNCIEEKNDEVWKMLLN